MPTEGARELAEQIGRDAEYMAGMFHVDERTNYLLPLLVAYAASEVARERERLLAAFKLQVEGLRALCETASNRMPEQLEKWEFAIGILEDCAEFVQVESGVKS